MNETPKCRWCTPDSGGAYSMCEFQNPENDGQKATLSVYWAHIVVEIDLPRSEEPARLTVPIHYCPMCGRRFTEYDG